MKIVVVELHDFRVREKTTCIANFWQSYKVVKFRKIM